LNGRIQESSFNRNNIPSNTYSIGRFVNRDFSIAKENCQRAKVLSAQVQCKERLALIEKMKEEEKAIKLKLYLAETKKCDLNRTCEDKLIATYIQLQATEVKSESTQTVLNNSITLADILPVLSKELFGSDIHKGHAKKSKPTKPQILTFAQLRQPITKFKRHLPQYKSLSKNTDTIVEECL
jgi:hypothetical protein